MSARTPAPSLAAPVVAPLAPARAREAQEPTVCLPLSELLALVEAAAERGAERAVGRLAELLREDERRAARGAELVIETAAERGAERALRAKQTRGERERGLVDAATVADALHVTRQTVYQHAAELGGVRIGSGPRARWRFDLARALEAAPAAMPCCGSKQSRPANPNAGANSDPAPARRRRRMPNGWPVAGAILQARPGARGPQ